MFWCCFRLCQCGRNSVRRKGRRQKHKSEQPRLGPLALKESRFCYSNFSTISGICSLAFASDFTRAPSIFSELVLRAVASSLTSRNFARSSIFFSRNDSGLLRLNDTRLFSTAATSISDPVRIRSELSLNRSFQSLWELNLPFSSTPETLPDSTGRITGRKPTAGALLCGTITFKPLERIRTLYYSSLLPFS